MQAVVYTVSVQIDNGDFLVDSVTAELTLANTQEMSCDTASTLEQRFAV